MKLTLQIQLLPDKQQSDRLTATMKAFNAAANWLAGEAFRLKCASKVELQQLFYYQLREKFGLSAQMAIRCIAQVCEAYSRDKSVRPHFKPTADIVGAKNIRSGALVIAREVSVAALAA